MEGRRQNVVQRVRQFNKTGTLRGKNEKNKVGKVSGFVIVFHL